MQEVGCPPIGAEVTDDGEVHVPCAEIGAEPEDSDGKQLDTNPSPEDKVKEM